MRIVHLPEPPASPARRRRSLAVLALGAAIVALGSPALAVPSAITYTAWLIGADGEPVVDAPAEVVVTLWDAEAGGASIGADADSEVYFDAGYLQVVLDGVDVAALGAGLWAEVTVDGETFEPRQRIVSVPYALEAGRVRFPTGPVAPEPTSSGELWYDSAAGVLRVFDGTMWVQAVDAYSRVESDSRFAAKGVEETVGQLSTGQTGINQTLAGQAGSIDAIQTAASELTGRVETLESGAEDHAVRIGALESTSDDHTDRLTALEAAGTSTDERLTTLEETDVDQETALGNLQQSDQDAASERSALQEALDCARACGQLEATSCHVQTCDAGACVESATPLADGAACVTRFGAGQCSAGSCRWLGNGAPGVYGIGLTYLSGRLSISCHDQPCSPANPGYAVVPSGASNSAGNVTLRVDSADHYFDDAKSAPGTPKSIAGNTFGTTAGVDWPSTAPRPFFLYAVDGDGTDAGVAFGLSPDPTLQALPASDSIAYRNQPAASQSDSTFFAMSDASAALLNGRPVLLIGRIRMYKDGVVGGQPNDSWWVQPLAPPMDGIGAQHVALTSSFPNGQMGAAAGSRLWGGEGTVPEFASTSYQYRLGTDGYCDIEVWLSGDGGVDGAGPTSRVRITLPYAVAGLGANGGGGSLIYGVGESIFQFQPATGLARADFYVPSDTPPAWKSLFLSQFPDGVRAINGHLRYRAF
ncbi:MAG: hypothetical protein H6744_02930 [Deltaproteobacteria bacterium]|nr:hypothetical protein [Deltaproteobacteria bacterium]MCB9785628.1 hypothetical protein [Deltaproteobacteria bacterium]